MKFWKTYAAVAAVAALLAYIFLVDAKKPASSDKSKDKLFASLDKAKIKEVTLTRPGEVIHLVKEGGAWKMTSPTVAPADLGIVDIVLSTFESAEITDVVTDSPSSLADFGLDHPTLTVAGVTESGTLDIAFGDKAPDGSSVYAKQSSSPRVIIVPSFQQAAFDKKAFEMRDRSVLHLKRDQVRTVDLRGPNVEMFLEKDAKGDWTIQKPLKTKGSKWGVDGFLVSFENLLFDDIEAKEAKDASDLKAFGLDKPVWTLVLQLADGTSKKLEVGALKSKAAASPDEPGAAAANPFNDKYFARDTSRNLVGAVNGSIVTDMTKVKDSLRSRYLLDFPALETMTVDVTSEGKKRSYTRTVTKGAAEAPDARSWKQTAPDKKDLEAKTVDDILFDVTSTEVQEFIDNPGPLSAYGLDAPTVRVELTFENRLPGWFEIGVKDGATFGRRDNDVAVLKLADKGKDVAERFRTKL